jgi:hypothetical protein
MCKFCTLLVAFVLLIVGCDSGTSPIPDPVVEDPTIEDPIVEEPVSFSISYKWVQDNDKFNYIATYTGNSRGILDGKSIVNVNKIPGGFIIVETTDGYYVKTETDFIKMILPNGGIKLHIFQFSEWNNKIYFGVDNKLYSIDNFNFNVSNAILVISDNIFISAADTLLTNLHYIVDTDNTVRYWPGDIDSFYRCREYGNNNTADTEDDIQVGLIIDSTQYIRDKLHIGYIAITDMGIYNIWGENITHDNIAEVIMMFNYDGYNRAGWGQSFDLNGVLINNRIDLTDEDMFWQFPIMLARDTMIREYRERLAYRGSDTTRYYLGIDKSETNLIVTPYTWNYSMEMEAGIAFTIEMEDGHLLPNMFISSEGVYVVINNSLRLYIDNDYTIINTFTNRIDAFTVLPDGNVILMDMYGDWFNSDGTVYSGDNIMAQY